MPKQLELQGAGGQPLASFDFGEVPEGTLSPPLAVTLRNTGDLPLTELRAWIEQESTADGELRLTLAGVAITGTSAATATALPDLAAGAGHAGTAEFSGPTVSVDHARLRVTAN